MISMRVRCAAALPLTRLSDSALRLRLVLGDARSPGLGSLSLRLSARLLGGRTLQQLLGTACPGEGSGP